MDITSLVVEVLTALILALIPIAVAASYPLVKRAVSAVETSRYAEAYAALDPVVQSAVEAAAAEALTRAIDAGDEFARNHVAPKIQGAAYEAARALNEATGVRVDLQQGHIDTLVRLAADEVETAIDEIEAVNDAPLEADSDGLAAEAINRRFEGYAGNPDPSAGSAWRS
jgi:hypothetical protein